MAHHPNPRVRVRVRLIAIPRHLASEEFVEQHSECEDVHRGGVGLGEEELGRLGGRSSRLGRIG